MSSTRLGIHLIAAYTVLLSLGCSPLEPPCRQRKEPPKTPRPTLSVDYAGCAVVHPTAPVQCIYDPFRPLRVWVHNAREREALTVRIDGEASTTEPYSPAGIDDIGLGIRVSVPPSSEQLTVTSDDGFSWSLMLCALGEERCTALTNTPSSLDVDRALGQSHQMALAGDTDGALRRLARIEPLALRYPRGAAELAAYRGQVRWRQGRLRDAALLLRDAARFGLRMDVDELAIDSLPLYAATLVKLGYYDAAGRHADRSEELVRGYEYAAGWRCRAMTSMLRTVGWVNLELRRRGHPYRDPRPMLEEALQISTQTRCGNSRSTPGIRLSLALLDSQEGRHQAALEGLERTWAEGHGMTADEALHLLDAELQAKRALSAPMPELWSTWSRLLDNATRLGSAEANWLVALRKGQLHAQAGESDDALAAYQSAEEHAERLARLSALGIERVVEGIDRWTSTAGLISVLLDRGEPARAFAAARRAAARRTQAAISSECTDAHDDEQLEATLRHYIRARTQLDDLMLGSPALSMRNRVIVRATVRARSAELQERADELLERCAGWAPASEHLQPRQDGELLVGLYPSADEWLIFVQDDQLTTHRVPVTRAERLDADRIISLLGDRPAAARTRIRVLAIGAAQDIDMHVAMWRGRPLVHRVPVVYGAELPWQPPPSARKRGALLVSDPTHTLTHADREIEAVATQLRRMGWIPEVLRAEDTIPSRLLPLLPDVDLLHYSGHVGREPRAHDWPPYAGGSAKAPASMILRQGTRLHVQDLLMGGRSPRFAVLLGCRTGIPHSMLEGPSLAAAFLAAGAEQVIASTSDVRDTVASALGRRLYTGRNGERDLADWLSEAQAELLPWDEDVSRFRVWVR